MDPITQQTVLACAGAGGASGATYVDDVFSTFLYEGNNSTLNIANGIDLSNEGGLVWLKRRSATSNHALWDTERGVQKGLSTNNNSPESDATGNSGYGLTAFNSNGFTIGSSWMGENISGDYCSWTFRKAPGFFDIVEFNASSSGYTTVSHNLGSAPGMILVKKKDANGSWYTYHRGVGNDKYMLMDSTIGAGSIFNMWNNTDPTSTQFQFNGSVSSGNHIAYLFAHDDQSFGTDEDEAIIKCGSYTNNSSQAVEVDLGFEPQWVMVKTSSGGGEWVVTDTMRGAAVVQSDTGGGTGPSLAANSTNAESSTGSAIHCKNRKRNTKTVSSVLLKFFQTSLIA